MNEYIGQYSCEGSWIPLSIRAASIEEALTWIKSNIQPRGVVVAQIIPEELLKAPVWVGPNSSWTDCPTYLH